MKNNPARIPRLSEMVLRSVSLFYLGFLILLPIVAITAEAFRGGLRNLLHQISLPQGLYALKLTFLLAFLLALINIVMGTATAWVLVRYNFPLKNFMNALIDIPFAIPTVVTGIMLVALYGPNSLVGGFFKKQGIEIVFSQLGIILALLFVTFPFVVRAVQPVLMEMERDMEEAAQTLGASRTAVFFRIIIPTLMPAILTGAALSFSRALGEFGSIVIVAGNIPFKTQVASVYVYGEIESDNIQSALGTAVILLGCSFIVLMFLNVLQKWSHRHGT